MGRLHPRGLAGTMEWDPRPANTPSPLWFTKASPPSPRLNQTAHYEPAMPVDPPPFLETLQTLSLQQAEKGVM